MTLNTVFQEHVPSIIFNLIISSTIWGLLGFMDLK